jgi:DDE family transposase
LLHHLSILQKTNIWAINGYENCLYSVGVGSQKLSKTVQIEEYWEDSPENPHIHGIPIAFELLPARWDELVPVQHLLADLPEGASILADKGYISQYDELLVYLNGNVRLIPKYRKNMRGNSLEDSKLIKDHRSMIETVNSQLEKMGLQRLHARSNEGVALKTLASLVALAFANFTN